VAARQPGLITPLRRPLCRPGHEPAARHLEQFQAAFDAETRRWLSDDDLHGRLLSDGELAPADFTLALAEQVRNGGPLGQGFPEPLFDGVFEVLSTV